MKAVSGLPLLFPLLCGCVSVAPPARIAPAGVAARRAEQEIRRISLPLIIEVALLPEPGRAVPREAPARRREYVEEIKTCAQIGAAIVRLQPIAAESSTDDYRFDRSVNNYRALLRDLLAVAPDIIIDCDLGKAGEEVEELVRCNKRIELDSTREEDNPVTVAVGEPAMGIMREAISGGGHLRLGLHDSSAWPYGGAPTNLDYLRQAISMARAAQRPLATPAQARKILGLPPLTTIYAAPSSERVTRGSAFFLDAIVGPIAGPFNAYVVIVTPSGKKLSFVKGGKLVRGIAPFTSRRRGMEGVFCETVAETVIKPGVAPGIYGIHLALFRPHEQPLPRRALVMAMAEVTVQ